MIMEKLLNPQELAEALNVRPGTIYSWLSRGVDIPYVKIGGSVRFREKAVMEWLLQKERERRRRNFEL
jgi:excisionase family DNA binding protein